MANPNKHAVNDAGVLLSEAAKGFVGAPFRLHGRDPDLGLDCVGLVLASLRAIGRNPPETCGYRLRNSNIASWLPSAERSGLYPANGPLRPGDVLLIEPGPAQQHLVILCDEHSAVHAHAGLRRVVQQPMEFPRNPIAHWRLR